MVLLSQLGFRYWLLPLSVMLLMRCDKANVHANSVNDPAHLQVNIIVNRRVLDTGQLSNFIQAFIKDESGKTVVDPGIQVRVNGQSLRLNGGSTNYYGAFPYYELSTDSAVSVQGGTTYTFTMVLKDGTEYPIGRIATQPDITPDQLPLPKAHSRSQPLLLRWRDIGEHTYLSALWKRYQGETSQNELLVSKINETTDKWGHVIQGDGSANQADYITLNVGTGNGSSIIPRTYFEGPQSRLTALSLMLTSIKTVDAGDSFRKGSSLSSERTVLYRVTLID